MPLVSPLSKTRLTPVHDGLPQVVEIEVSRRCNRRCPYCPQAFDWYRGPEVLMPRDLYSRIIGELAAIPFMGRLSFHLYNEPLLRRDLPELVGEARRRLPAAFLVLYTNGDLLNDSRYVSLLRAGIDLFFVTRHDATPLPDRPFQRVRYLGGFPMSSRGALVGDVPSSWRLACHAPAEMLMIRYTGEVVLCHEDATGDHVMGDLASQTIAQVWSCAEFERVRSYLINGDRERASALCRRCDNRLHPLPDTAI